eukprot:2230360-Prymnesium_polylepis.1
MLAICRSEVQGGSGDCWAIKNGQWTVEGQYRVRERSRIRVFVTFIGFYDNLFCVGKLKR